MLICPTIPYGATESLCDYPGTINLGTELLYQVLGRVCDSLFQHGARRFVILNGHGGNIKSIDRVGYDIQRKGGILAELNWWLMAWDMDPAWKGGHGGGEETAAILGIDPSLVDQSEVAGPMRLHDVSDTPEGHRLHLHRIQGRHRQHSPPDPLRHPQRMDWSRPPRDRHRGVGPEDAPDHRRLHRGLHGGVQEGGHRQGLRHRILIG